MKLKAKSQILMFVAISLFFTTLICRADEPKPEFFGVYLVAEGKLIEPSKKDTAVKPIFTMDPNPVGIKDISGCTQIKDKNIYIIYYQTPNANNLLQGQEYSTLRLSKLIFKTREHLAPEYDPMGSFKNSIYDVNMWLPESNYNLKIAPIKDANSMYKLVPGGPLPDGVYAIHYGDIGYFRMPFYSKKIQVFIVGNPDTGSQMAAFQAPEVGDKLTGKVLGFTTKIKTLGKEYPVDWTLRTTSQDGNKVIGVVCMPQSQISITQATMFEGTFDGKVLNIIDTIHLSAIPRSNIKAGDKINGEQHTEMTFGGEFSYKGYRNGKLQNQAVMPRNLTISNSIMSKYEKDNVMVVGYAEKDGSKSVYTIEVKDGKPVPGTLKEIAE